MDIFQELELQYYAIDKQYADAEFEAAKRGWPKKEKEYRRKRELNDQAYFLFMFTRLEDHISQEVRKRIARKKAANVSWREKAPWENMPNDAKDIHFKKRVALIVESGKSDYNLIADYYKERNSIGHGGAFQNAISMPNVIKEFVRLRRTIRG